MLFVVHNRFSESIITILKYLEGFWFCVAVHKVTVPWELPWNLLTLWTLCTAGWFQRLEESFSGPWCQEGGHQVSGRSLSPPYSGCPGVFEEWKSQWDFPTLIETRITENGAEYINNDVYIDGDVRGGNLFLFLPPCCSRWLEEVSSFLSVVCLSVVVLDRLGPLI